MHFNGSKHCLVSVGRHEGSCHCHESKKVSNHHLLVLLAHLSRRLKGELIGYPPASVVCPSVHNFKHLLSNQLSNQSQNFYMEPPWVGGTKVCSRHLGHMTKMAGPPIYGKNPSNIFFSGSGWPISTKLGM